MNLNQLSYFNAVCVHQSISKAADQLHISQPSLSAAIRELENEFGVTLFTRHYRGVRLTEEGQTLYELSKDLLNRADQTAAVMKDIGSGRKVLRLGVPPMIGSLILPRIYRDFPQENISLEITEGGYHDLVRKLLDKELDLAFLPHTGTPDPAFACLPVTTLEVCCCAKADHALATSKMITPTELGQHPMVLFENSFLQTELILSWLQKEQVTPEILLQTQQLSTMLRMLESGAALGFLFRELIDSHPALSAIPTEKPLLLPVSLARLQTGHRTHAMDAFIHYTKTQNPFNG